MIEQNPDGSNRRSGIRTGIFSPISGKICCINEINCRLLQKRNRKAPGYGMRITEIKKMEYGTRMKGLKTGQFVDGRSGSLKTGVIGIKIAHN